jgi:tetratricopeptide (TPR) repeat protein
MTEQGASFAGKRGRGWAWLAAWVVPLMMGGAYCVLIATSDVGTSGALWESGGFGLVLVFWFAFRILTRRGALARAIAVGDHARILELAKGPLDRAVAYELRGDWPAVLAALDEARPASPADQVVAAAVRIHALVETGEVAKAREVLGREIEPRRPGLDPRLHAFALARAELARGRVLAAEGQRDEAAALLRRVIDDVRTMPTTRAAAQALACKLSAAG